MDENQKIIYDLLKEVRKDQKEDSKKIERVDSCVASVQRETKGIKSDLEKVKSETAANTKHMGEHMARTDGVEKMVLMLTDLHQDNQKRIELLEDESKRKDSVLHELKSQKKIEEIRDETEESVKDKIKNNIKWIVTILTAIVGAVTKVMGLW